MEDSNNNPYHVPPLWIIPVGIGSATVVVTIYHCIICWCKGHYTPQSPPVLQFASRAETSEAPPGFTGNLMPQRIPAHKYQKGIGLIGEDGMCAVCLCEFEEGEELRTLPECLHSYHAPCIDMWLYSHSNCPMCRTSAAPYAAINISSLH